MGGLHTRTWTSEPALGGGRPRLPSPTPLGESKAFLLVDQARARRLSVGEAGARLLTPRAPPLLGAPCCAGTASSSSSETHSLLPRYLASPAASTVAAAAGAAVPGSLGVAFPRNPSASRISSPCQGAWKGLGPKFRMSGQNLGRHHSVCSTFPGGEPGRCPLQGPEQPVCSSIDSGSE